MEIESDRTIDALTEMLEDKDFEVRMYAKEALNRIRKKSFCFNLFLRKIRGQ